MTTRDTITRKELTDNEHNNYIHLCGKTGKETEKIDCNSCKKLSKCLSDHSIKGIDNET